MELGSSMVDDISKVTGLFGDAKVFSVNVVECEQNPVGKRVNAMLIVLDDGHTEVRCPIGLLLCSCPYGNRVQSVGGKKGKLFEYVLIRAVIIVLLLGAETIAALPLFIKH